MRIVSASKYSRLRTTYERAAERLAETEKVAAERLSTITRQAREISRLREQQPAVPVPQPQPRPVDLRERSAPTIRGRGPAAWVAASVVALVMGVFVAGTLLSRRWALRAAARDKATPAPAPVVETEPGCNLADRDLCERLWALPAHRKPTTTPEGDQT